MVKGGSSGKPRLWLPLPRATATGNTSNGSTENNITSNYFGIFEDDSFYNLDDHFIFDTVDKHFDNGITHYKISLASPAIKGIETFTALNHECWHILFDSQFKIINRVLEIVIWRYRQLKIHVV